MIRNGTTIITIADDSEQAQKIKKGFDYEIEENELRVKKTKSGNTPYSKSKKVRDALFIDEIKEILAEHLEKCNCE